MRNSKEIILLTQYFYPDIASTGLLMTDICIGLTQKGYSVKVFTAKPHYENKLKVETEEIYKGIKIKRLFSFRLNKTKRVNNILNSFTYFLSVFFYVIFKDESGTFMMVSNPPFLSFIGPLIKYFKGNDFIYIIHDFYPDAGISIGILKNDSFVTKIWNYINNVIFRTCKGIVVLGEVMQNTIENKMINTNRESVNEDSLIKKIHVIHNWANDDLCNEMDKKANPFYDKFNIKNKFVVLYSGNLSIPYRLDLMLHSAKELADTNVVFVFIGDGEDKNKLIEIKNKNNLNNVLFFPYQKYSDIKYTLDTSDLLILSTKFNFDGLSVPSKLYTYMAVGKGIIAIAKKNSELYSIINDAQCGFCFDYTELDKFTEKIIYLNKNPELVKSYGINAKKYYLQNFSYKKAIDKYEKLFI
jgi:glycosyltransferase involved in cell wall biosynthesis